MEKETHGNKEPVKEAFGIGGARELFASSVSNERGRTKAGWGAELNL